MDINIFLEGESKGIYIRAYSWSSCKFSLTLRTVQYMSIVQLHVMKFRAMPPIKNGFPVASSLLGVEGADFPNSFFGGRGALEYFLYLYLEGLMECTMLYIYRASKWRVSEIPTQKI